MKSKIKLIPLIIGLILIIAGTYGVYHEWTNKECETHGAICPYNNYFIYYIILVVIGLILSLKEMMKQTKWEQGVVKQA